MTARRGAATDWWPALWAGAFALAVSLAFLPMAPGIGDSAEFTLALALAGIPHPTGYPLYVLAGYPFVHAAHAFGLPWAAAANLWSAVGAAVAAVAYARLIRHATGSDAALPQLLGVALLVINPVWMESATVAEVYSWSHAWIAAAGAFTLGRLRALDDPARAPTVGPWRTAILWGLLCGLGAAHHATFVFFAVPLSIALLAGFVRARRGSPWAVLGVLAGVPVVIAGVGWLAWRAAHPAPYQWPVEPTVDGVLTHVLGRAYGRYLGGFAPNRADWTLIRDTMLAPILIGLPATALFALSRRAHPVRLGLLAMAGGAAVMIVFLVSYGVPDPAMYFVPPLMASLLAAGLAMDWLATRLRTGLRWAVAATLVVTVFSASLPRLTAERKRIAGVDRRIRAAWALIPFDRAVVLWADDHVARLIVFQRLEGQRPGLVIDNPALLTWPVRRKAFERRAGFDPLDGHELRTQVDVKRVPEWLRQAATMPVVDFPDYIERVPPVR